MTSEQIHHPRRQTPVRQNQFFFAATASTPPANPLAALVPPCDRCHCSVLPRHTDFVARVATAPPGYPWLFQYSCYTVGVFPGADPSSFPTENIMIVISTTIPVHTLEEGEADTSVRGKTFKT